MKDYSDRITYRKVLRPMVENGRFWKEYVLIPDFSSLNENEFVDCLLNHIYTPEIQ